MELVEAASTALAPGLGLVVGVIIAVLVLLLIVIDVSCYFINGCGALATVCSQVCSRGPMSRDKTVEEGDTDR